MIIVDTAKPLFPWENDTRRQVATIKAANFGNLPDRQFTGKFTGK